MCECERAPLPSPHIDVAAYMRKYRCVHRADVYMELCVFTALECRAGCSHQVAPHSVLGPSQRSEPGGGKGKR